MDLRQILLGLQVCRLIPTSMETIPLWGMTLVLMLDRLPFGPLVQVRLRLARTS